MGVGGVNITSRVMGGEEESGGPPGRPHALRKGDRRKLGVNEVVRLPSKVRSKLFLSKDRHGRLKKGLNAALK